MITIIGNTGCGRCLATKRKFEVAGIDFEYKTFDRLPTEEQETLRFKAIEAGQKKFPILLNEERLVVQLGEILPNERDRETHTETIS